MKNNDLLYIMSQAMDNAREGITISDATQPDNPLIYVNDGFVNMTGYSREESTGKNCRYLQGPDTARDEVTKIRNAIAARQPLQVELLNYRKNGESFWNALSITPVLDKRGELTHFIGIQEDVSQKKELGFIGQRAARQKLIAETSIESQEKERLQIGMELHDNINQMLATLRLYLGMANGQENMKEEMILRSKDLTDAVIEEIRKLSKSLVGPNFEMVSLKQSLTELVNNIRMASPFALSVAYSGFNEDTFTQKQKLMLYRIVQEGLNNVIKYAQAKNVTINLAEEKNGVLLNIKDDGIGFDATKVSNGIGLRNISSRVELEEGKMQLVTGPDKGCELIITIPAHQNVTVTI